MSGWQHPAPPGSTHLSYACGAVVVATGSDGARCQLVQANGAGVEVLLLHKRRPCTTSSGAAGIYSDSRPVASIRVIRRSCLALLSGYQGRLLVQQVLQWQGEKGPTWLVHGDIADWIG